MLSPLNKSLHSTPFSGFNTLVVVTVHLLKRTSTKIRIQFFSYVACYVIAALFQVGAFLVVFVALRDYLQPVSTGVLATAKSLLVQLDLAPVATLVVIAFPAIVMLFISSRLLGFSRVGLAHLALALKTDVENRLLPHVYAHDSADLDAFQVQLNGMFGALRALFFNSFVVVQTTAALVGLAILEPWISLVHVAFIVGFLYYLTILKPVKVRPQDQENSNLPPEDISEAVEELGVNPKSFERLERMRIIGRNYAYIAMISSITLGVMFSLNFMVSLDKFTAVLMFVRFATPGYVPVGVIASACMPYRKTAIMLFNAERILEEIAIDRSKESLTPHSKELVVFLDTNVQTIAVENDRDVEAKLRSTYGATKVTLVTYNTPINRYPYKRSMIRSLITKSKPCQNDRFTLFHI